MGVHTTKTCRECHKNFLGHIAQKTCNPCKDKLADAPPKFQKICEYHLCKQSFGTNREAQRFHSDACKTAFHSEEYRRRIEDAKNSNR